MALDPLLVKVDPGHLESRLGERHGERQAGVAETDDADLRLARRYPLVELGGGGGQAQLTAIDASNGEEGSRLGLDCGLPASASAITRRMSFPRRCDALIRDGTVVWGFLAAIASCLR